MAKKTKKRGLMGFVYMFTGIAIIVYTLSSGLHLTVLKDQKDALTMQRDQLLQEQAVLQNEVSLLNDDDYVTRYARENYVFTREGEQVAIIPQVQE